MRPSEIREDRSRMQTHSHDVWVFKRDEPLYLYLHEFRKRVAGRVGQDAEGGPAGNVDDGAGFGGSEEAEEGLRHEEGAFDVDFLIRT